MKAENSTLKNFRLIAVLEGCSYILLLAVGMPLKYLFNLREPMVYLGWTHGLLFILFCILLLRVWIQYRWSFIKVVLAFVASLVPFGTFVLDNQLKKEQV